MKPKVVFLLLITGTTFQTSAQLPPDLKRQFDEAERRIVRLPPTAFPNVPRNIARELQRRGCTIPPTPYTKRPQNPIMGEFAKLGQIDWAVLCSIKDPWCSPIPGATISAGTRPVFLFPYILPLRPLRTPGSHLFNCERRKLLGRLNQTASMIV